MAIDYAKSHAISRHLNAWKKRQRLKGNSARNENEANSLSTLNDDPPNDTVPSLIVAALGWQSFGRKREGRKERREEARAEIAGRNPHLATFSTAGCFIGIADDESRAYSGLGDHGKHRLRRAISRLERDFVLLHSNQPGSGSGSGSGESVAPINRPPLLSLYSPSSLAALSPSQRIS